MGSSEKLPPHLARYPPQTPRPTLEKKVILFKGEINREIASLEQLQMDIKEAKLDQKQQKDFTKNIKQA